MITYSRYINQEDHVWYDSSNILYSKCYDTQNSPTKTVKIVFKGGRTYLYKDVDANEYLQFKMAESNGNAFNKIIKKYTAVRIADTDVEKLNDLQKNFKEDIKEIEDKKVGDLVYNIKVDEKTGEFIVFLGERPIFRGIEGNFSILNLLTSFNFKYKLEKVDKLTNDSDENLNEIKL